MPPSHFQCIQILVGPLWLCVRVCVCAFSTTWKTLLLLFCSPMLLFHQVSWKSGQYFFHTAHNPTHEHPNPKAWVWRHNSLSKRTQLWPNGLGLIPLRKSRRAIKHKDDDIQRERRGVEMEWGVAERGRLTACTRGGYGWKRLGVTVSPLVNVTTFCLWRDTNAHVTRQTCHQISDPTIPKHPLSALCHFHLCHHVPIALPFFCCFHRTYLFLPVISFHLAHVTQCASIVLILLSCLSSRLLKLYCASG